MEPDDEELNAGLIAVTGRTNVGKSTLTNTIIGDKIAITTETPQTTRNRILGVAEREDAQLVLLDTPGIHKPETKLGQHMVETAYDCWGNVDVILFMVDANAGIGRGDNFIANRLEDVETPVVIVPNKTDLIDENTQNEKLKPYRDLECWDEFVPVSAKTGDNVETLVNTLTEYLPRGPRLYPKGVTTNREIPFRVAEIIREKIIKQTHEEIPHSVAVVLDRMEEGEDDDILVIEATVFVERDSQKGIVIGQGGNRIKSIGQDARKELEVLLNTKVYLDLLVKVSRDWSDKAQTLRKFGLVNE